MRNRQTKLVVNLDAIINNYKRIQECQPDKKILPVLKANGYGIGLEAIRTLIDRINLDIIGTAIVDEAIDLREKIEYRGEIIVLNQPAIEEVENIVKFDVTTGCCYIEFLEELNKVAKIFNKKAKVHIEIETGMGRTGVQLHKLEGFVNNITKLENIEIEGIYTHFSVSDTDLDYTNKQIDVFNKAVDYIKSKISTIKYVHCGNSAATIQIKDLPGNMIRPGIILYGYLPDESLEGKINLEPCCVLKSKISYIKTVEENTSISYGRTFITKGKSIIANVPIGYADGFRRELSNRGNVIIKNKKFPIVGRVCMDSFMIDVTDSPDIKIGDEVYIWENKKITVEDIAKQCNTINYEILATISNRVVKEII